MKNLCRRALLLVAVCLSGLLVSVALANEEEGWVCKVNGSEDYFKVYASQRIYASEQFSHYQLMDGLTVLVINKQTRRFNRISNLNLLPHSTMDPNQPPERFQLFHGMCEEQQG